MDAALLQEAVHSLRSLKVPGRPFGGLAGSETCARVPEEGGGQQAAGGYDKLFTESGMWWFSSPVIAGFHWLAGIGSFYLNNLGVCVCVCVIFFSVARHPLAMEF